MAARRDRSGEPKARSDGVRIGSYVQSGTHRSYFRRVDRFGQLPTRDNRSVSDDEGFYSDEAAVADYLAHRHSGVSSPNRGMEEPSFEVAAGPLVGLDIVDLGCGDGTFARQCVDQGCSSYLGVDTSEPMLARASDAFPDPRASFAHSSIEEFQLPDAQVDLIAARMSLHYVADRARGSGSVVRSSGTTGPSRTTLRSASALGSSSISSANANRYLTGSAATTTNSPGDAEHP